MSDFLRHTKHLLHEDEPYFVKFFLPLLSQNKRAADYIISYVESNIYDAVDEVCVPLNSLDEDEDIDLLVYLLAMYYNRNFKWLNTKLISESPDLTLLTFELKYIFKGSHYTAIYQYVIDENCIADSYYTLIKNIKNNE